MHRLNNNITTLDIINHINNTSDLPSTYYVNLEFGSDDTNYTAPADGWYALGYHSTSNYNWCQLVNVTKNYFTSRLSSTMIDDFAIYLPAHAGDTVKLQYANVALSLNWNYFRFYYCEGANNT